MTNQELIQKMYAAIHNAVAPSAPGNKAAPASIFTMMPQGSTIIPEDYDPEDSAANRNRLANTIPYVQKDYVSSGKVSDVYKQILTSQFPPDQEPTDEELKRLSDAEKYLEDSDHVDAYITGMVEFAKARDAYWSAANSGDPKAHLLKPEMDAAMLKWVSRGHKEKYESSLAVQHQFYQKSPSRLVEAASRVFEEAEDPLSGYEAVYLPKNWQDPNCALSWADILINEGTKRIHIHKDIEKVADNFTTHFSTGFWSVSSNSKYKDTVERLNQQSTACTTTLRMKIARVQIYRDWLNTSLMSYKTSWIPGLSAGQISNGTLQNTQGLSMPVLPTELVLAKDVEVYCNFSDEERRFLQDSKDETADLGVSFLWFRLGKEHSEYHDTVTDQEQTDYKCNAKISLGKQPMILGFINSVLPYYAYKDGTGMQAAPPLPKAERAVSPSLFCRAEQPQFFSLRAGE